MVICCDGLIQEVMVDGVLYCLKEQTAQKSNCQTSQPSLKCKVGFCKPSTRSVDIPLPAGVPCSGRAQSDTSYTPWLV